MNKNLFFSLQANITGLRVKPRLSCGSVMQPQKKVKTKQLCTCQWVRFSCAFNFLRNNSGCLLEQPLKWFIKKFKIFFFCSCFYFRFISFLSTILDECFDSSNKSVPLWRMNCYVLFNCNFDTFNQSTRQCFCAVHTFKKTFIECGRNFLNSLLFHFLG